MTSGAALTDLTVFQRHASETDKNLRVVPDHLPTCASVQISAKAAQDMRHHSLGSGKTIGEFRTGKATDAVQKPLKLTLGVVKPAGAGPAVRAAIDRLIAKIAAHTRELIRNQTVRFRPAYGHERLAPAQIGALASFAL